jgi:creatinine amidohydrolase
MRKRKNEPVLSTQRFAAWLLMWVAIAGFMSTSFMWGQAAPAMRTRYFTSLTNPEIEQYLKRNDVIFIPVGTAESMGAFPTDLEYVMAEAYALKMAEEGDGLILPHVLYFYPGVTATGRGSVYIPQETGLAYLKAIAQSLLRQGFRRQIYISAHGPSNQFVSALVREFFEETKDPILYVEAGRLLQNAQTSGKAPQAAGTNNFRAVGYGAYQIVGRLADVPLSLDVPTASEPPLPPPPDSIRKLSTFAPGSGAVGSYEPDAEHASVRPLNTKITAAQREQLGREGATLIEAAVKAMDVKSVIQALRDEDKYVNEVIVPRYRDILPK